MCTSCHLCAPIVSAHNFIIHHIIHIIFVLTLSRAAVNIKLKKIMFKSDRVNRCHHSPWLSAPYSSSIVRPSLHFIMITFFLATTAPVSITHAFHKTFQTVLSSHRRHLFRNSNNLPNVRYSVTRIFSSTTKILIVPAHQPTN